MTVFSYSHCLLNVSTYYGVLNLFPSMQDVLTWPGQ